MHGRWLQRALTGACRSVYQILSRLTDCDALISEILWFQRFNKRVIDVIHYMCLCGSKRKRSVHWTRSFGYKNNLLEYVWHVGSVGRNIPKRNARVMYQMCLLPYKIHSLLRALTGSYRNEKCECLQWALIPQPLEILIHAVPQFLQNTCWTDEDS